MIYRTRSGVLRPAMDSAPIALQQPRISLNEHGLVPAAWRGDHEEYSTVRSLRRAEDGSIRRLPPTG
jgi:hypothetical protein